MLGRALRVVGAVAALAATMLLLALPSGSARAQTRDAEPPSWDYRIVDGDTLIGIGNAYLFEPRDWIKVQRANHVRDPLRLQPGSTLRIPVAWIRTTAVVAEIVFVQGEASIRREGSAAAEAAHPGTMVQAGDALQTNEGASLTLRFIDNSRLLLVPNSRINVVALLTVGKPRIPSARFELLEGDAEIRVPPASTSVRPSVEIRTPAVNLGVRGTEFRARYAGGERASRLEVLAGRVAASNKNETLPVDAGLGLVARQGQSLSPPTPLLPPPDLSPLPARVERVPLRLAWSPMAGAQVFRAQVFAASRPEELLLDGTYREAEARFADLPDGDYLLRVRALDANAIEGRDAQRAFVLKARPEPPFAIEPAPGAASYGDAARIRWTRSEKAERYRLQIANAPGDFSSALVDRADIDQPQFDAQLPPGEYRWRVASIAAGDDQGPFADPQAFIQRPIPRSPAVQPSSVGDDGIVFRWSPPAPGEKVRYQVATDASFEHIVVDEVTDAADGKLTKPRPGRYYLRAKTIDEHGFEGNFGQTQSIDVPRSAWWLLVPILFMFAAF